MVKSTKVFNAGMITNFTSPQQYPKCCQKIVNEHSKCAYEQQKR